MAAKNIPASTDTSESPPLRKPNRLSAKSTSLRLTAPWAMRSPVRINIGTATRAKVLMPWNICWGTTASGVPWTTSVARVLAPMVKAMGTPISISTTKEMNSNSITPPPAGSPASGRRVLARSPPGW